MVHVLEEAGESGGGSGGEEAVGGVGVGIEEVVLL